ncbi:MAG: type II secretion system F family protein [Veillonellales bacterium]
MAKTFAYRAKDATGQLLTGTIVADSHSAVAAFIRGKGYYVTNIREHKENISLKAYCDRFRRVSQKELAIFCRQFATMAEAGLSFVTCIHVLYQQTTNAKLKMALQDVDRKIQEGESLAQSMAVHPDVFPEIMVGMIEAGELGGVLDTVLDRLALHFEKEYKMNEKVKSAMAYPAVVMTMAGLVVVFVLTFVLPTFMKMFDNMKVQLPLPTRILLSVSGFIQDFWPFILLFLGAAAAGFMVLYKKPSVKMQLDRFVLQLPVFGLLTRKVIIARFSRTMGTLLRGGMPILKALEVVKKTTGNTGMTKALMSAQNSVREGQGLSTPLSSSSLFTPMVVQMVAIGEESGELDKMLDKIADFYESDVDDMVSRLSSLIEPVLIGVLGVIVGGIIISIALPMFDAITSVGQ